MGPSLPDVQKTERNETQPEELLKASSGRNESGKFSEVLRNQNPKVTRAKDTPSEKQPETETSVRSETEVPNRVRESGKPDRSPVKATEKEKAMLKFMDSMESEFSIPPTKIAEAMATLKPTDLLKAPEETATQVIQNLGLAPEDQSRAMQLYVGFLQQWNQAQSPDSAKFFAESQVRQIPGGMEAAMLAKAERKQMLSDSLGQMSDKFFVKNKVEQAHYAKSVVEPEFAESQNRTMLSETMLLRPQAGVPGLSIDETGIPLEGLEQADQTELNGLDPRAFEIPVIEKTRTKPMYANLAANLPSKVNRSSSMLDMTALDRLVQGEQSIDGMQTAKAMTPSEFFNVGRGAEQAAAQSQVNPVIEKGAADSRQVEIAAKELSPSLMVTGMTAKHADSKADFGAKNSEDSSSQGDSKSMLNDKTSALSGSDFFVKPAIVGGAGHVGGATVAKGGEANPNMQAIMNQAQLIVNRGGGQAVIKLNPEGLGEVRLKVMVVNGRVNVEMATQTKEAKQMIESSIGDLRSSLSTHKLAVDHVKVDVGNQAQSDSQNSQQHRGMDARPDLNRDQARSFLHQFREETSSRRDPFFEMPGIKAYNARREPTPIPAASERAMNRYSGEGRGERMNIVA